MRLLQMLEGVDEKSRKKLRMLKMIIGKDERISWYPSAGNDIRDLFEFSEGQAKYYGMKSIPNLFVHTDYYRDFFDLDKKKVIKEVYPYLYRKDFRRVSDFYDYVNKRHNVVHFFIKDIYKLRLKRRFPVSYDFTPGKYHGSLTNYSPEEILLFEINFASKHGNSKAYLLYFFFENFNFLSEILLKYNVKISHMVKIREGCGLGGCYKSISLAYSLLSVLGVKYLYADWEVHFDPYTDTILYELVRKHGIDAKYYLIKEIHRLKEWSGFSARLFEIIPTNIRMNSFLMANILKRITNHFEIRNASSEDTFVRNPGSEIFSKNIFQPGEIE